MSKLVEVKMPPLDGTEFVVVWIDSLFDIVMCDRGFVDSNGIFRMNHYDIEEWESDLDARYFVAAD